MHQHFIYSFVLTFLLCAFLPLSNSGVPKSRYEAMMKQESPKLGLYNSTDKVIILTGSNFKESVINKNYASLVEFYNSYCGHCKRFAPVYKELAENTWNWRDVIKIMAIDCAAEENNDICREYEVMSYPTMRYIGPNFKASANHYGIPIESQDIDVIKRKLAKHAMNETLENQSWPNFSNLTDEEAGDLFHNVQAQVEYVVLILNSENASALGAQTILNFNRYPQLSIRRISDEKIGEQFHLNSTHRIAVIDRNNNIELLTYQEGTAAAYKNALEKFIESKMFTEKPDLAPKVPVSENTLLDEELKKEDKEILKEVKRNKHLVYQADLEQAIRNILRKEIPRANDISGERLLALQRFINVLHRYHPLGANGKQYMNKIQEYVAMNNQALSGKEFRNKVKELEEELSPVYSSKRYIGCTGSKPEYRGFTCSLWKLFHFLTVQASMSDSSTDPLEVLQGVHGFVKFFFGCTDCSEHFQDMAKRRKIWNTPTKDEAVLWLWEAHNEVNNRLAGDETEDPQFPKLQFPTKESCQQCQKNEITNHEESIWNRDAVLQFLKNINNPSYVSRYGLDDPDVIQPSLDKIRQKRMITNVFSDMDMRMGVFLYGFCIVMLIAAFKLFAFKGYRKKPYVHDFLGKV